jgi:hypothetical protein
MTKAQMMEHVWGEMKNYSVGYTFEPINSKGEEYLKLACPKDEEYLKSLPPDLKFNYISFSVSGSELAEHRNNKEAMIYEIQRRINELFTDRGKHDLNVKIPANMASKIYSGTINSIVDLYVTDKSSALSIVYGNQVLGIQVTGKFVVSKDWLSI